MKKKIVLYALVVMMSLLYFNIPLFSGSREDWKEIEARLPQATGEQRLTFLVWLAGEFKYWEPNKTLKYGKEALDLLKKYPNPVLNVEIINRLGTVNVLLGNLADGRNLIARAKRMAEQINDRKGYADALGNFCYLEWNCTNYENAVQYGLNAIEIYETLGNEEGIAEAYDNIGISYMNVGDYNKSLDYLLKSLVIYEKSGNIDFIAGLYNNIANIYSSMNMIDLSLENYKKSWKIFEKRENPMGCAVTLMNISEMYILKKNTTEALKYLNQAFKITEKLGVKNLISSCLGQYASIYELEGKGDLPQALDYFNTAYRIDNELNNIHSSTNTLISIARIKRKMGQTRTALSDAGEALALAARSNDKSNLLSAYEELSEIHFALKDYGKAFDYYQKFFDLNNSIFSEENLKKYAEIDVRYKLYKIEEEIDLLKKNRQLKALQLQRQRILTHSLSTIAFLTFLSGFMIYIRYRYKSKANRQLENEIREHKITTQKLAESESIFKTLAEKSTAGIYIIQDEVFKYVNPKFLSIFGCAAEDIFEKDIRGVIYPDDRPLVLKNIRARLAGDVGSIHYDFRGIDKQGEILFLEVYGTAALYRQKPAIIGTLIDISRRKKASAELIKSQKMEYVALLTGRIAEEFDQIVSILSRYMEIALHFPSIHLKKYTDDRIGEVSKALSSSRELVDKLKNFTKGRWTDFQKVSLQDIIKNTMDFHPGLLSLQDSISINHEDGLFPLLGDERQIREVFYNLLKNAREAEDIEKTSAQLFITIHARNISLLPSNDFGLKKGNYVQVSVADNGIGIPQDQLGKVFDPYFTTKESVTKKGLGLGLAICYSIVKKHNGHISVYSEAGKGTIVEILLPAFRETTKNLTINNS